MESLALIGSICFAICGVPGAYEAYKKGTCDYSWGFLWLWAIGEACLAVYSIHIKEYILLLNYAGNGICLAIIMYYNKR